LSENTTTVQEADPQPVTIPTTTWHRANIIAGSRDFPDCRTPEKAAVRIMAGEEMGVPPITAVSGIRITNGRVSMDSCLMAGMIERSDIYDFRKLEHSTDKCVLEFSRAGEVRGTAEFTIQEARKAGLTGKDVWQKYPADMLHWRAVSRGARQYCAGLFGGSVYTHEELGYTVDQDGRTDESEPGRVDTSELCTREQRAEIRRLLAVAGKEEKAFLAGLGLRLMDELTGREADKEIRTLGRKTSKTGRTPALVEGSIPATERPADGPGTGTTATDATPGPRTEAREADDPGLSPSQKTLAEAFDESRRPSTLQQKSAILDLMERVILLDRPELDAEELDAAIAESIGAILTKRCVRKIAELNHLQAAALIEQLEGLLVPDPCQPGK
jgi:hypothetical protein